jgi:benzylsuccinate CoA-transferase BbsF subunit
MYRRVATRPTAKRSIEMTRTLDGVRVIDFTVSVAGPIACAVLADMGAEVIKIEEPNSRVVARADMPPKPGAPERADNRLSNFNELNRGKRSVAFDLGKPEGRELFLKLAAKSDIVVENYSPRVVYNLGIDYESVRAVKPDIIYLSMPAFGKTGPYSEMRSYGPGVDAMSGLSHLTGYLGGPPLKPGNYFCDQNSGLHTAFAALSALYYRRQTGKGQYIEVPMIEGEIQVFAEAVMDVALNGREQTRIGNRHPSIAPHGVYPCQGSDAWIAIAAVNDAQWLALCRVMCREDLLADPRFADAVWRWHNQDALDPIIAAWTAPRDKHDLQTVLQEAGVSAAAALAVNELFDDPHVQQRGLFQFVEHPESIPFPHTRIASTLSETPAVPVASGPQFGGANRYVLGELLGLDDETIAGLAGRGAVELRDGR